MPLLQEPTSIKTDQSATKQPETSKTTPDNKSNLMTIIGQCLPFAPLVFEQFTGQKVPQLSGTMAEITSSLQQVQLTLTQVINNQQQIWTRIERLEKNANQQLINLTNQFQSLRLTHTKERQEIEYHPPQLENQDPY